MSGVVFEGLSDDRRLSRVVRRRSRMICDNNVEVLFVTGKQMNQVTLEDLLP